MNNYIVYCHTNTITGEKYIGQTCQIAELRFANGNGYCSYYLPKDSPKQSVLYQAILKYGWMHFSHEILKENLTQEEANYWEKYYIEYYHTYYKDEQCNGYNMTTGGIDGYNRDNFDRLGVKHTEETKKKISNSLNNFWADKEKSDKVREAIKEKHSGANNSASKKVICIETGEIYNCLREASDAVGLKSKQSIYIACKDSNRTAKGYHWKYIE